MFDELDDPNPPAPASGARAAAVARGRRHLQRRTAALGGVTAVVLAVAVAVALAGSPPGAPDVVAGDGSATPSAFSPPPSAEESPSAPPSPSPSLSPSPVASPKPSPSPPPPTTAPSRPVAQSPSQTPPPPPTSSPDDPSRGNLPDGKPGWSGGFSGCGHETITESTSPSSSLAIAFELDQSSVPAGGTFTGAVVITNNGSSELELAVRAEGKRNATLTTPAGEPVAAAYWSDAIGMEQMTLAPGESRRYDVEIKAVDCGDTSEHPETPLPKGSYRAVGWINWGTSESYGTYYASPVGVTLT